MLLPMMFLSLYLLIFVWVNKLRNGRHSDKIKESYFKKEDLTVKIIRKVFVVTMLVFFSGSFQLFAQASEELSDTYHRIDLAIAAKSADAISKVLSENKNTSNYPFIENYTLKKTRQLIITDNLELARQTALAVIDNNLENFDAVELYSYIDKAILNQQAANQAAENRRRLEQERIAALNAKSKQQLASRGNYQLVNTASGQEVYLNEQQSSFSSKIWTIKLGLVDFVYQKVSQPDYSSLKYGLAVGANIFYPSERLIIGADIFADAHIVTLSTEGALPKEQESASSLESDDPQEFFFSGRFVPEFAFADFSKYIFLRAGVSGHMLASNDRERTGSSESFIAPVVGVALDNIHFSEVQLRMFGDYNFASLMNDKISTAMEFGGSIMLPMAVNDKTKVGIELGVQDLLLLKKEGEMENRAKFTFAIGVGNVTK